MSTEKDAKSKLMENISWLTHLITTIRRPPPPERGDGIIDKPLISSEVGSGFVKDFEALGLKDSVQDIDFAVKLVALGNKPWDDSQYQLEKIVQILTKLPPESKLLNELERLLITRLWNDITKPPNMIAGDFYRAPDASNYSRLYPEMGKSHSRYARNVRIQHPLPLNLPDPGLLFDSLMVRKEFKPHPSAISSVLFHLATIITHDLFDSSPTEPYINETSSYLDLTPLYGRNSEQLMSIRQGRLGLLKPDTFADRRILLQPPGVGCLLVLFSRNHNYIAKRLLQINELDRFSVKDPNDEQELKDQDENLFQTARLINTGFYVNSVVHDYLHTILGLNKTDSQWYIDPAETFPKDTMSSPLPTGIGNQVSLEFNYIYRWHPVISEADAKWVDDKFKVIFGDDYPEPGKELTIPVFQKRMKEWRAELPDEPEERNFGGLERITEGDLKGAFRDTDLVREMVNAVNAVAGSFGTNGIPKIFRAIEILGITSARKLGVCSLNELRRFLNLQPYKSFEDMNPNKEIAEKLRLHYGHIDNVELYPGVILEKTKPPILGSGIAVNFTISRTILSDAVNLIRNDRFLTDDFNSHNLTNWGFSEVQTDPDVADGSLLYKIIMRNTNGCYKPNSIYAMFPFTIPSQTKENLEKRGIADQYDFSTPITREEQQPRIRKILSYGACKKILSNKDTFNVTYDERMKLVTDGVGYFLGFDDTVAHDRDRSRITKAFYTNDHEKFLSGLKRFFSKVTQDLIDKKKITFDGKTYQVDVVRDVCNLIPVHFCSEYFGLPLKTPKTPQGYYTEQEAYTQLTIFFMFIFVSTDPGSDFKLTRTAKQISEQLHAVMQTIVDTVSGHTSLLQKAADSLIGVDIDVSTNARQLIQVLMSQYKDSSLATWNMIGTMSGAVALMGKAASLVIDFYLRPANKPYLEEIRRLADKTDQESENLLLGYVLEALRFNPAASGLFRRVSKPVSVDDGSNGTVNLRKGDTIFLSFKTAHKDPVMFPEPDKINPRRPVDSYLLFGQDFHKCFGRPTNFIAIPIIVKTILKIKTLQRAPDRAGQINQSEEIFVNASGNIFPFPSDMVLRFTE